MEKSVPLTVREFFDTAKSLKYDRDIRASLPGYEALHGMVNALLSEALDADAHLLVAGAGTGMELLLMGTLHPRWRFTACDPSPEMLAVCRERVSEREMEDRVTFIGGTIDRVPSEARFDAATSILVSHFILSEPERLDFFGGIARRLVAGAPLVTADLFGEKGTDRFTCLQGAWERFNLMNGRDPGELRAGRERSDQVVLYLPERRYGELLAEAGFTGVSRFYQALLFGGWICRRNS